MAKTWEEAFASVMRIMDAWDAKLGPLVCRSCRNWNHWHWPDGTCQDARCECKWRPKKLADLPQYG